MSLPALSLDNVVELVPDALNVRPAGQGGQKVVFRGDIDGTTYALKFVLLPADSDSEDAAARTEARARREIETMKQCKSHHMIKLGPIDLKTAKIADQQIMFFSEEYIEGCDLGQYLQKHGALPPDEVCRLGIEMCESIGELWDIGKVHRDIKPQNIMRRDDDGSFVLLDAGYAFDVVGASLSEGMLVGTFQYFAPERFDYSNRRAATDFRCDMFSLGVTLYELATGSHPFVHPEEGSRQVFTRILTHRPPKPSTLNAAISTRLDQVILRLLGKAPHLRYRTLSQLKDALGAV